MLPIGVFAQGVTVRSDFVHENFSLGRLSHIDHLLHHIVGILIFHHLVQWTLSSIMIIHYEKEKKKKSQQSGTYKCHEYISIHEIHFPKSKTKDSLIEIFDCNIPLCGNLAFSLQL